MMQLGSNLLHFETHLTYGVLKTQAKLKNVYKMSNLNIWISLNPFFFLLQLHQF